MRSLNVNVEELKRCIWGLWDKSCSSTRATEGIFWSTTSIFREGGGGCCPTFQWQRLVASQCDIHHLLGPVVTARLGLRRRRWWRRKSRRRERVIIHHSAATTLKSSTQTCIYPQAEEIAADFSFTVCAGMFMNDHPPPSSAARALTVTRTQRTAL